MPLLSPTERKKFTIKEDECIRLARLLAEGRTLKFQSSANRNWVAKKARTMFGINTAVRVSKDQLFNPRYTVEGFDLPTEDKHYMTLYVAERVYAPVNQPVVNQPPVVLAGANRNTFGTPVYSEGNIW